MKTSSMRRSPHSWKKVGSSKRPKKPGLPRSPRSRRRRWGAIRRRSRPGARCRRRVAKKKWIAAPLVRSRNISPATHASWRNGSSVWRPRRSSPSCRMARAAEAAERAAGAMTRGPYGGSRRAGQGRGGAAPRGGQAGQGGDRPRGRRRDRHGPRPCRGAGRAPGRVGRDTHDPPRQRSSEPDRRRALGAIEGQEATVDRGRSPMPRRLERLAEEARTLEQWLKQIARSRRGQGRRDGPRAAGAGQGRPRSSGQIDRIAEMHEEGKSDEARREAAKAARAIEAIARSLDMLHRDIVAPATRRPGRAEKAPRRAERPARYPQDRRRGRRLAPPAVALLRELETKEAMTEVRRRRWKRPWSTPAGTGAGGNWSWDGRAQAGPCPRLQGPAKRMARRLQDQIQEMILKDMMSSRDEATPPEFKELVERYYEVLSRQGGESSIHQDADGIRGREGPRTGAHGHQNDTALGFTRHARSGARPGRSGAAGPGRAALASERAAAAGARVWGSS